MVTGVLLLAGCAGTPVTMQVERQTAQGDYQQALSLVTPKQTAYKGANILLYYLDKGALLQRLGEYPVSNQELDEAERLMEEFSTTSVTQAAASFLVNDMTMDYSGEDFEQVMVNAIKALNYLYAGDFSGAGVEARKVNTRLLELDDKYQGKAIYSEDAFARYLAAFVYEAQGEYNNAYIDYKKAYKGFIHYNRQFNMPMPEVIKQDLLRLSRWMGFDDEFRRWRRTFKDQPLPSMRPKKQSEVLLVIYDGLIPSKRTTYTAVPIRTADHEPYVLKVAFPEFSPREPVIGQVRVGTAGGEIFTSQVVEPLSMIAYKNLGQRLGLISAKAIARATAKYIAAYNVRKATHSKNAGVNMLVGLATNVFTYATEQADTRSWRTLPNRFHLVRCPVAAGKQELEIRVEGLQGEPREGFPLSVELKEGQKLVVPLYYPN